MSALKSLEVTLKSPRSYILFGLTNPIRPEPVRIMSKTSKTYSPRQGKLMLKRNLEHMFSLFPPPTWKYYLWTNVDLSIKDLLPGVHAPFFETQLIDNKLFLHKAIASNLKAVAKGRGSLTTSTTFAKHSLTLMGGIHMDWDFTFDKPIPRQILNYDAILPTDLEDYLLAFTANNSLAISLVNIMAVCI